MTGRQYTIYNTGMGAHKQIPIDMGVIYQDLGCEHSPSCLSCPLPVCKYDNPSSTPYLDDNEREIAEMTAGGSSAAEIARELGINIRTVRRKRAKNKKENEKI